MEGWSGYEGLADAHYGRLRRLCALLLGDREEADEVVQEVFLKAWTLRNGGGAPNDWAAWLTRVAVNACHDRRRVGWWPRFRRSDRVEDLPLRVQEPSPADLAIGAEIQRHIWEAFRALPTRQREVFLLRYVEDQPTAQVAATLGVSEGSVKRHLYRAIHRLRQTLGGRR